jgi:2-phospho-L-lactate guanylyltransferase
MSWTAIVPIKPADERKSRLAAILWPGERLALSDSMLRHVLDLLDAVPSITRVMTLSRQPLAGREDNWLVDRGRGLNAELQHALDPDSSRLMILLADLPLIARADLAALIAATAGDGVAIAPDRRRQGTNALAFDRLGDFRFGFGPGSFGLHRQSAGPRARIVEREGLALDVDLPEDLIAACAASRTIHDLIDSDGLRFG